MDSAFIDKFKENFTVNNSRLDKNIRYGNIYNEWRNVRFIRRPLLFKRRICGKKKPRRLSGGFMRECVERLRLTGNKWKRNGKMRAFSFFAFYLYISFQGFDNIEDNHHPEPGSFFFCRKVGGLEIFQFIGCHADAIVNNINQYFAGRRFEADDQLSAVFHRFNRVFDQVDEALADLLAVAEDEAIVFNTVRFNFD